ncbi:pentatricopeptide repeat-containing protein [Pyrus ussuriensis x Pyrus communis]|uniref:Pentatricopeptide repeat-containing protein n=1 Tax=Pyrus ussuriensis x Pyrus communis TaxID=2448454 RepID=A0A5N5H295_9ROSA|nr:pentatricopeptide repeat-containing protein [Pyrus ussuriensis x Pyrus communis]
MVEKNSVAWVAMTAGYGKRGNVVEAEMVFDEIQMPDVSCWAAMVACYAQNGCRRSHWMYKKMREAKVRVNEVAMVGAISACTQLGGVEIAATLAKHVEERKCKETEYDQTSHAGLVEEGCQYFELITQVFGIEPLKEHYACMVDLLGRAGLIENAYNLVIDYVGVADAKIWGPLLGACKVHGNAELSEIAARHLFEIEQHDTGNYELLANTYAEANKWDDADRVKKMMTQRGMVEAPGCSWRGSTV